MNQCSVCLGSIFNGFKDERTRGYFATGELACWIGAFITKKSCIENYVIVIRKIYLRQGHILKDRTVEGGYKKVILS